MNSLNNKGITNISLNPTLTSLFIDTSLSSIIENLQELQMLYNINALKEQKCVHGAEKMNNFLMHLNMAMVQLYEQYQKEEATQLMN